MEHTPPKNNIHQPKINDKSQDTNSFDTFKSIPINIINSDTVFSVDEVKKRKKNNSENVVVFEKKQLFQEIVYFGCNLCPFICTKDSKISDHIKSVHTNKGNNKKPPMKCPGCSNIFYHKLSLRSHLIHDHEVGRSDINKIVNSIVYVSVLSENNTDATESSNSVDSSSKKDESISFLSEDIQMDDEHTDEENHTESLDLLEQSSMETDKLHDENEECSNLEISENYSPKEECVVDVPVLKNDSAHGETIVCRRNSATKNDDQKRSQKCCVSTCAVRMRQVVNMAYHVKCHFGKVFRCLECGANFVVWKTLQTHLWRAHNIDMELYSCDKCDYKTYSLAKLNNIHKLIHSSEKPFLCDLCGKGFKNPKQLRNHKIIHKVKTIEKMQNCTYCDRTFADKRLLKVHIAGVHEKIKPFCCSYCGYKAASNGALKLHIRQHTGKQYYFNKSGLILEHFMSVIEFLITLPFKYALCFCCYKYYFSLKSRHAFYVRFNRKFKILICLTGEKPFTCDSCDYSTSDHNSLRRHKSRHSGEKKYKCMHCDYACIQSSTYKTHLKTKHPGLEEEHMFSCRYCQFRSINKDKYTIHIASHKEKKQPQKIIDIIENICEETTEGLEKRVVEIVSMNKKNEVEFVNLTNMKPQDEYAVDQKMFRTSKKCIDSTEQLRLQETPVALISKINDTTNTTNHCIILPVQNENILNLTSATNENAVLPTTTAMLTNNIQYFYSSTNVLLEIIDEKAK